MSHSDAGGSCSIASVTGTKSDSDWACVTVDPPGASPAARNPMTSRTRTARAEDGICIASLLAKPGVNAGSALYARGPKKGRVQRAAARQRRSAAAISPLAAGRGRVLWFTK